MKIFWVSHSSVIPTYREKFKLLSTKKNLTAALLLPHIWPEAGKKIQPRPQDASKEGFPIKVIPVVLPGRIKRHFYPSFFKSIQPFKPDLIHIEEEPYSLATWQALRAAQKLNSAFIFFTWENLLEKFSFPHNLIRKYVLKKADHAIAGDLEAAQLLKKAGFPSNKISVIPQYGVNPKLFQKRNESKLKKELKLDGFTVGYIGRLVPEKGVQHLLEAFAGLKIPTAHLLIVGNGPLRKGLEEKAAKLGIASQIRWVQAVDQPCIPDYINCMDVLVLPSLTTAGWKEQFGRVLIEAQACEVPVIGSNSGAIPEVIGKAGLIYPEGKVEKLRENLQKLVHSKTLRTELGKQGRQRVLKLYTNQKIADQIYNVYQRVLAQKSK
jgi:glycosyltransferase involved in cell wall biosynthesis